MLLTASYLVVFVSIVFVTYALLSVQKVQRRRLRNFEKGEAKTPDKVSLMKKLVGWANEKSTGLYKKDFFREKLSEMERQLEQAGMSDEYTPGEYLCLHGIGGGIGLVLSLFVCLALMSSEFSEDAGVLGLIGTVVFFTGFGFFAPSLKLSEMIKARKKAILHALPFTLDLITVSVEAGLDFSGAIQRIIERAEMNELNYEFYLFLNETKLGKRKVEALERMSARIDIPVVGSIIASLVQAEELGMRIGQILRIQSQALRTKRMQFAEKSALEAPVKMLIPLALFIFPAVFIVLLGPMIIQFISR